MKRRRSVIKSCPRCGGSCPRQAEWRELTVPFDRGGFYGTHWFLCLALGEPVILGHDRPGLPHADRYCYATTNGAPPQTISVSFQP